MIIILGAKGLCSNLTRKWQNSKSPGHQFRRSPEHEGSRSPKINHNGSCADTYVLVFQLLLLFFAVFNSITALDLLLHSFFIFFKCYCDIFGLQIEPRKLAADLLYLGVALNTNWYLPDALFTQQNLFNALMVSNWSLVINNLD